MKIISGGQTGADRAALEIAKELGLETGGTAPRGYRTESGPDPSLKDFGLVESPSDQYPPRTWQNVSDSEGTVWFGKPVDPRGLLCTLRCTKEIGKPFIMNPSPTILKGFIKSFNICTLNVAGNRASVNPGVAQQVRDVLTEVFRP